MMNLNPSIISCRNRERQVTHTCSSVMARLCGSVGRLAPYRFITCWASWYLALTLPWIVETCGNQKMKMGKGYVRRRIQKGWNQREIIPMVAREFEGKYFRNFVSHTKSNPYTAVLTRRWSREKDCFSLYFLRKKAFSDAKRSLSSYTYIYRHYQSRSFPLDQPPAIGQFTFRNNPSWITCSRHSSRIVSLPGERTNITHHPSRHSHHFALTEKKASKSATKKKVFPVALEWENKIGSAMRAGTIRWKIEFRLLLWLYWARDSFPLSKRQDVFSPSYEGFWLKALCCSAFGVGSEHFDDFFT